MVNLLTQLTELRQTLLIDVTSKASDVISGDLRLALDLGNQTTNGFGTPALLGTIAIQVKLALAFVVNDVSVSRLELLQLLLGGCNSKGGVLSKVCIKMRLDLVAMGVDVLQPAGETLGHLELKCHNR